MKDEGLGTSRSIDQGTLAGNPGKGQDTGSRDQGTSTPVPIDGYRTDFSGDDTPPPLDRAPLAYENIAFLNSADARLIRIAAEYVDPLARFRKDQIEDPVAFLE